MDLAVSLQFIGVGIVIILGWCLDKIGSLGPFLGLAYFMEVSYFVTVFALCILSWTFLSQLVLWFSTSHALSFHSRGFSRLMTVIWRSVCFRIILSLVLSTSSFLFVALAFVLPIVICSKVHRHLVMSIVVFNCQLVHEKLHCEFSSLFIHQIYDFVSGSLAVHAQENCIPNTSFLSFRFGKLASFCNLHNMGMKFSRCHRTLLGEVKFFYSQ